MDLQILRLRINNPKDISQFFIFKSHDSLAEASTFVEVIEKRQGLKVACLEEIAFHQGWINVEKLKTVAMPMAKNQYGRYLLALASSVKS